MAITTIDQANGAFNLLIEESNALVGKPQSEQLTTCRRVRSQLQALVTYTGNALEKVKRDEMVAKQYLVNVHSQQTEVFKERGRLEQEAGKTLQSVLLSDQRKQQEEHKRDEIQSERTRLQGERDSLEKEKIERIVGTIPLLNIGMAIARGEPELLVPGFDLFSGRLYHLEEQSRAKDREIQEAENKSLNIKGDFFSFFFGFECSSKGLNVF